MKEESCNVHDALHDRYSSVQGYLRNSFSCLKISVVLCTILRETVKSYKILRLTLY
jgi:hypothetical protein